MGRRSHGSRRGHRGSARTLAAVFGTVVFVLAIARWQFDVVSNGVLWITAASGLVNLAAAWAAVRRLATHLEPRRKPSGED